MGLTYKEAVKDYLNEYASSTINHVAQGSTGDVYGYANKPVKGDNGWYNSKVDENGKYCYSLGTTVSKIKDVIEGFEVDIMGNNNRIADIVLKVSALNEELKGLERINGGISRKIENLKHTVNILNAVRDGSVHD